MKTKYENVRISDSTVEDYEFTRDQYICWADDMCAELKHVLEVAFARLEPEADEYIFKDGMESGYTCFNKIERKRNVFGDWSYMLATDEHNQKYELSRENLKLQYDVLLHLQREIDFSDDSKVDLERYEDDLDEWVGPLWRDSRDLLEPLLNDEELCDLESEYTFDNPIDYGGVKYVTLSAENDDMSSGDIDGYITFILSSADGKQNYHLDSDSPDLIIRTIDAILKEGQTDE